MGQHWRTKPQQPCARCGEPTYSAAVPPMHRTCRPRSPGRPSESWAERKRRAATVAAWRELYGDVCPGWQRPAHAAGPDNPLTADHVEPWARTGREDTELGVLCRSCNGRKRDRPAVPVRTAVAPVRYSPSRDW